MEPYKAKKMPLEYIRSNELYRLLCETEEVYGEYKGSPDQGPGFSFVSKRTDLSDVSGYETAL